MEVAWRQLASAGPVPCSQGTRQVSRAQLVQYHKIFLCELWRISGALKVLPGMYPGQVRCPAAEVSVKQLCGLSFTSDR